jgi:hypothetical protein
MTDKTPLIEEATGAPTDDDVSPSLIVGATAIPASDDGITILTRDLCGQQRCRLGAGSCGWHWCCGYPPYHKPARLPGVLPDDVWDDFSDAISETKNYILTMAWLPKGFFLIASPFALLFTAGALPPHVYHRVIKTVVMTVCFQIWVIVLMVGVFYVYDEGIHQQCEDAFRRVVEEHQNRFAAHGVELSFVKESCHRGLFYGRYYAVYAAIRLNNHRFNQAEASFIV